MRMLTIPGIHAIWTLPRIWSSGRSFDSDRKSKGDPGVAAPITTTEDHLIGDIIRILTRGGTIDIGPDIPAIITNNLSVRCR